MADTSRFSDEIPEAEQEEAKEILDYETAKKVYGSDAVQATSSDHTAFCINVPKAREYHKKHRRKDMVWVDTYVRSDGATVRGHWRKNTR